MSFADDAKVRKALREPFPREQIGRLPATQKRPELDFVGHAAVTDRLNTVAPDWSYTIDEAKRARSVDENGIERDGAYWIRGTMTIGGVSRPEYGDGADPKEAIGNFIRRAAMRFGVAIDLWSREDLQPREPTPQEKTAGTSDATVRKARVPSQDAVERMPVAPAAAVAPDTTSVGDVPPSDSTEDASTDDATGGDELREREVGAPTAQAPDVKSPSRRCLHLKGTRTVMRASGGRNEVCVDCGLVIEQVEANA